jgi:hypothetical protein
MATQVKKKAAAPLAAKRPATVKAPAKDAAKPAAAPAQAAPPAKAAPAAKAAEATKAPKAAKAAKADKPKVDKPKKPKLVRDSFTIPKTEYAVLEMLKERAAKAGAPAKKSELLRAGIQALAGMQDSAFLAAVSAVPTLKTGRPAKA